MWKGGREGVELTEVMGVWTGRWVRILWLGIIRIRSSSNAPHLNLCSTLPGNRLQKINKRLAAERDDLAAQLTATTHRLNAAEASDRASKASLGELQARVSELQSASSELAATKGRLVAADEQLRLLEGVPQALSEAERERDLLRSKVRRVVYREDSEVLMWRISNGAFVQWLVPCLSSP